jgi:nucleotide-binding universal stress UspA family protein
VARAVEESNKEEGRWAKRLVEAAAQELRQAELIVSPVVREGDPKRALIDEAEGWGADAIFVGSVGFNNRLERFLLGSVSAAVVARAHCSVEVVRAEKGSPA